jgi:hypothetical protein
MNDMIPTALTWLRSGGARNSAAPKISIPGSFDSGPVDEGSNHRIAGLY